MPYAIGTEYRHSQPGRLDFSDVAFFCIPNIEKGEKAHEETTRHFIPHPSPWFLLCSFVMPSLAASYQNGSTGKVTVSGVWAFHGGRQPGETSSTSNGGNRGNHYNNRLYWYEGYSIDILQTDGSQYTPRKQRQNILLLRSQVGELRHRQPEILVDPTGQGGN